MSGSQLLATCALYHTIPVVVISGIYKLSPAFPSNREIYSCPSSPSSLATYHDDVLGRVTTLSPYYDYVDPGLVSLFITNVGGQPPSYIYRLLEELYDPQDYNFK